MKKKKRKAGKHAVNAPFDGVQLVALQLVDA